MRRELESIEIPGEHEARERTWRVAQAAFAERPPSQRAPRRMLRPAIAVALAVAALAAVLSPPGRAVLDEIREAVGVERAQPALFSLPAPGKLLVASDAGVWVVQQDGSKRLLGPYREASWSPFGRFVVAARENELAALEPDGDVRWTLARPGVRSPRWAGTETDTRIAYVDRSGLRVVAGDGTSDRLLVRGARGPIAWQTGEAFVLAYTTSEHVVVLDAARGRQLWRAPRPHGRVIAIEWSTNGRRLALVTPRSLRVFVDRGHILSDATRTDGRRYFDAAFRPGSAELAVGIRGSTTSRVRILGGRQLGSGIGRFEGLEWSPDGTWLLRGWPSTDLWSFGQARGRHFRAVANVSEQFRSRSFPRVEGWCCAETAG